jgi:hypothetical protein
MEQTENKTETTPQAENQVETIDNRSDAEIVMSEFTADDENPVEVDENPVEAEKEATPQADNVEAEAKTETPVEVDYKTKYDELNKELEKYRSVEKQEIENSEKKAKDLGFQSLEEKKIYDDAIVREFQGLYREIDYLTPELKAQAMEYLRRYSVSLDDVSLREVKRFISPDALEKIALDRENFKKTELDKLNRTKEEQKYETIKTRLTDFVGQNRAWFDTPAKASAITMIVDSFGLDADLGKVKSMIDTIEAEAIKKYESKKEAETRKQQLSPINNANLGGVGEKWFTKSEIDKMSDSDYVKNGEKIALQMSLEKQGKLPRTII